MPANIYIKTEGMRQMENDFGLLATPVPIDYAKEDLSEHAKSSFDAVRASIPEDSGDARRPGGSLKASARYEMNDLGDRWELTLMVGTEDDEVPYAKWVLYKNIDKPGGDYLAPMDEFEILGDRAMNLPFDSVFGTGE